MAVDQKFDWDEDAINALYRAYQRTRDGVEYHRYQDILEAAREIAARPEEETRVMERQMDVIRAAAREQFLDQHLPEVAPAMERDVVGESSSTLERHVQRARSSFFDAIEGFLESISPKQWVPVAVTAALAVAVVPLVLDNDPGSPVVGGLASHTDFLSTDPGGVAGELDRLRDFQLGFSSSSSDYARAFSAGVVFTNVVGLGEKPNPDRLTRSLNELSSLVGRKIDPAELDTLGDDLQAAYSDSEYWSVFVFGQWVETGYLLSRLALRGLNNDAGTQATQNLIALLEDRGEVIGLLQQSGHYAPRFERDMERLALAVGDKALDQQELGTVGNVLLKLRTVESKK